MRSVLHCRLSLSIRTAIVLAFILSSMAYEASPAEDAPPGDTAKYGRKLNDEERLEALDMLAKAMRENYEKIRTWKGEYHFIDGQWNPQDAPKSADILYVAPGTSHQLNQGDIATGKDAGGGHWRFERGNFRFSLDRTKNKYYAAYDAHEPIGYLDVENGAEGWPKERGSSILWLAIDRKLTFFDTQTVVGLSPQASSLPVDWKSRVANRLHASSSHPNQWVRIEEFLGTSVPGKSCERVARRLRREVDEEVRQETEKNLSIYVSDQSPPVFTLLWDNVRLGDRSIDVYDGKVGFNLIREIKGNREAQDRNGSHLEYLLETKITYRKISDVFVPEACRQRTSIVRDKLTLRSSHRSIDFVSAELNVDIPDADFDLKRFGFRYGERLLDRGEDKVTKLFIYDDLVGFVPTEDFHFDPSRVPQKPDK